MERCGNSQNDVEYFHTRRLFDAVQMQFVVERLAIDPQQPGRLGFVAAVKCSVPLGSLSSACVLMISLAAAACEG